MSCYPLGLLKQAIEQKCELMSSSVTVTASTCSPHCLLSELLPGCRSTRKAGVINASLLAMGLLIELRGRSRGSLDSRKSWPRAGRPPSCAAAARADISFSECSSPDAQSCILCIAHRSSPQKRTEVNLKAMTAPMDQQLLADVMKVLDPVRDWTGGSETGKVHAKWFYLSPPAIANIVASRAANAIPPPFRRVLDSFHTA